MSGYWDERLASTEEAEWTTWLQEGTSANDVARQRMDELSLAGQVQQMSMDEFSAQRERLGVSRSLAAFLGGTD